MDYKNKSVKDKKLSNMVIESDNNPNLKKEQSFYGEALRLREELLPLPERQDVDFVGNTIILPARAGLDVLTATEAELITVLENSQTPNNGKSIDYAVRIQFILRVMAVRFPNFYPQTTELKSKWVDMFEILKANKIDDVEFLGESEIIVPRGNLN